jgi:hypothetical protein
MMNATQTEKPNREVQKRTPTLGESLSTIQSEELVLGIEVMPDARIVVSEWVSEQFIPRITVRTQQ